MMFIKIAAFLIFTYAETMDTASTRNYTIHIYIVYSYKNQGIMFVNLLLTKINNLGNNDHKKNICTFAV